MLAVMNNEKIIRWSSKAIQIFKWIYLISFIAFLLVIIIWFLNRELFENAVLTSGFKAGVGSFNVSFNNKMEYLRGIPFDELSPTLMVWLGIRTTSFFLLGWMIIRQIDKIIQSIVSMEVFYENNVVGFQRIAHISLCIAVLASFNIFWNERGFDLDFTVPFVPLLASVGCYLLAVIFEEGRRLSDENRAIV